MPQTIMAKQSLYIAVVLACFSSPAYCMLSNALLKFESNRSEEQGQNSVIHVLVCGQKLCYPAQAFTTMMAQIAAINPPQPLSCLVVLPKTPFTETEARMNALQELLWTQALGPVATKMPETSTANLSVMLDQAKTSETFGKHLNIVYAGNRSHEHIMLFGSAMEGFSELFSAFERKIAITDDIIAHAFPRANGPSLSHYFESLEREWTYLEAIKSRYVDSYPQFSLVVAQSLTVFLAAKKKVTRLFSECPHTITINAALGKVVKNCDSLESLVTWSKTFVEIADHMAEAMFIAGTLEQFLQLIERGTKTVLIVVEEKFMVHFLTAVKALNFVWVPPVSQTADSTLLSRNLAILVKQLLSTSPFCWSCYKKNTRMKKCSACNVSSYCDSDCQRRDWPDHKDFCKLVVRKANSFDDH